MGNRRYDPDCKREAVRLVLEEGMGVREVRHHLWSREGSECGVCRASCSKFAVSGAEAIAQGE